MDDGLKFHDLETEPQSLASPGIRPGLARLSHLLMLLGGPERKFKAVHVVGTNGKGSTASTLASILKESGCRTALYTSPHLVSFGERLQIGGEEVPPLKCEDVLSVIKTALDSSKRLKEDPPTYFELITAAAFMIIADEAVDIAVVEAGLGGRLDATNILSDVILTLITPIGIDHSEYLGSTLASVAKEKFAVMRPCVPAISRRRRRGRDNLFDTAFKKYPGPGLEKALRLRYSSGILSRHGSLCRVGVFSCRLSHAAYWDHQTENTALALAAASALNTYHNIFENITYQTLYNGVVSVKWPGRFEIIKMDPPLVIVDGAHNPHALRRLAENTGMIYADKPFNIVLAMMRDKDITESLDIIRGTGAKLYCTEVPGMERSLPADELLEMAEEKGIDCAGEWSSPTEAVRESVASGSDTICCGSLFLGGYVKEHQNEI